MTKTEFSSKFKSHYSKYSSATQIQAKQPKPIKIIFKIMNSITAIRIQKPTTYCPDTSTYKDHSQVPDQNGYEPYASPSHSDPRG